MYISKARLQIIGCTNHFGPVFYSGTSCFGFKRDLKLQAFGNNQ